MAVAVCPKSETLAAFARGELVAPELDAVAGHVGGCGACGRALRSIPDDSLAGLARAAAVAPPTVHSPGTPAALLPHATAANVPAALVGHPRYRVIEELGAGGMGVVYKAEHRVMGRTVALKVVAPNLTARARAVERFRKEVRAAARLEHNNIVRSHDAEEAGGMHFLVMEFIEGISLDRLVAKKGPLPVPLACTFARQAALGLQHAAEKGMVHRDIKPQNLMVTRKGQVKILDFGIARFATGDDEDDRPAGAKVPFGAARSAATAGLTNPNFLMGTPDYLSPEQAKNSHDVDPRSDIYSLGCTLYFLLTGGPPFASATTLVDKLLAHTAAAPPPLRGRRPEVPDGLAEVFAKMTAKAPADRFRTAAAAAAALLPFTRSAPDEPAFTVVEATLVTPPPRRRAAAGAASDAPTQPASPTLAEVVRPRKKKKSRRPKGRRPWAVAGGVAVLFLLAAWAIVAVPRRPAEKAEKPTEPNAGETAPAAPKGKDEKAGKGNPGATLPTVIAPPRGNPKVLYVLPSAGVRYGDYDRVRHRLEEGRAAEVVTASSDGGSSAPFLDFKGEPAARPKPVPIDKLLTATTDLSEYSAVVFAGHDIGEYLFSGRGAVAAGRAVKTMRDADRPVAGIGLGTGVLAFHGALKGKRAAWCDPLQREFRALTKDYGVEWGDRGLTVDGKVITATGGMEADAFADAILEAMKAK
jgi:serine/threonine-protein kinase